MWRLHWQNFAGWTPFVGQKKPPAEYQDFEDRAKAEEAKAELRIIMPEAVVCIRPTPHLGGRLKPQKLFAGHADYQDERKLTR